MESRKLMLIGFVLLLLGFGLPFLMLLGYLPSTFFLNFFSYGASTVGLILGFIGIAFYMRRNRK
jgi:hypothetical protein